jgi:ferredoxin-nitrite reductase
LNLESIGKEVFKSISFAEVPKLLEHVLKVYLARRYARESFASFTRRFEVKQLQETFSA